MKLCAVVVQDNNDGDPELYVDTTSNLAIDKFVSKGTCADLEAVDGKEFAGDLRKAFKAFNHPLALVRVFEKYRGFLYVGPIPNVWLVEFEV